MRKVFLALLLLPFLLCAKDVEKFYLNKEINQFCGFKLGEKLSENDFVKRNAVKWKKNINDEISIDKKTGALLCEPPIEFMSNDTECGVVTLKDGTIAMIFARMSDFSYTQESYENAYNQFLKRIFAVFNLPYSHRYTLNDDFIFDIPAQGFRDKIHLKVWASNNAISARLVDLHLFDKYLLEKNLQENQETIKKDSAAFGL